jgi:hypothetical protein
MLAVDVPTLGNFRQASQFWRLRVTKEFDKPEFFIGQTVLHKLRVRQGEILHPVTVIGLWWNGCNWMYFVEFPEDHPKFKHEDNEFGEVQEDEIETM